MSQPANASRRVLRSCRRSQPGDRLAGEGARPGRRPGGPPVAASLARPAPQPALPSLGTEDWTAEMSAGTEPRKVAAIVFTGLGEVVIRATGGGAAAARPVWPAGGHLVAGDGLGQGRTGLLAASCAFRRKSDRVPSIFGQWHTRTADPPRQDRSVFGMHAQSNTRPLWGVGGMPRRPGA